MIKPQTFIINKSKIVLYPIKSVRTVMINIKTKGGSWYEPGTQWGASHFMEHLIFTGTQNFPDHESIEEYKQKYAISNNASTGNRSIDFWFKFPDVCINEGLNLMEEIVFRPTFPQHEFAKEINVIEQEYKEKWDSPYNRFDQIYIENLIGKKHLYTREGLGSPEFIKTLNRTDVLNLHQQFLQPQNMVVSIVGNFNQKIVKEKIKKILSSHQNSQSVKYNIAPLKSGTNCLYHHDHISQAYVIVTWLINKDQKISLQDRYGFNMISYMLGGSSNSVLLKKIRQELGLVYNINSRFSAWPKTGAIDIWATVDPKNINILVDNVKNEIDKFFNTKIDQRKFLASRNYMDLQTLMSYDSIYNIADNFVDDLFYQNKVFTPEDKIAIAKLSDPENLRQILQPQLTWDKAFVSIMQP